MKKKLFSMLLLGACFVASMSLFTSCKDYDDDIKSNQSEIAALRSELLTVKTNLEQSLNSEKSTYETQIAALRAQLESAINNKADQSTVDELQASLKKTQEDYAARMAVLTSQIEATYDAIGRIDQKADQSTVDGVIADLAALTGQLKDEAKAREAVEANLRIQMEALQKFMDEFNDAKLQEQIDQLRAAIGEIQTNQEISVMRTQMNNLETMIVNVNANLSALEVLVQRMLNSIALVPALYIDGIEAIEFTSLEYKAFKDLTKEWWDDNNQNHESTSVLVSNGTTEATYRLNPSTVQRDGIDEGNIDLVAARAETRAAAEIIESPVAFNGIKEYSNGLMTVLLKKKNTASLNENGNKITIVSLKVPRNAEKYEAADIYSENSRLAEISYTPRIASLDDNGNYNKSGWSNTSQQLTRPHHYWSYPEIYNTWVDANPSLAGVAKKVKYDETFDLSTIVTGCLLKGDYQNGTCQRQITKAELKTYGMEFEFDIPQVDYHTGVPNLTNQQDFAVITKEGVISSKTPAGLTNNTAVVGKEPLVRVKLVDKNHGDKVVDVRYFKIKWTMDWETPDPGKDLEDKKLSDLEKTVRMPGWCSTTDFGSFDWEWFVNNVYAALDDHDPLKNKFEGMSQSRFKEVYTDMPESITITWVTNWNPASDTNAAAQGTLGNGLNTYINWHTTTNEHGDALIADWKMEPQDIQTIYCNSTNDTKTFIAKVYFKSNNRKEWPNLWFNWKVTVQMPTQISEINGYNKVYWAAGQEGKKLDVLPVQFETPAQTRSYCVYDNNLMNAFTYYQSTRPGWRFIVTPWSNPNLAPECGSWDMQYNYDQTMSGYHAAYTPGDAASTEYIWKSKGIKVNTKHGEPWNTFGAYILNKGANTALEMHWDADHSTWCGNDQHNEAKLFGDHFNPANQGLLNALGQNDVTAPDGNLVPERTYTKPIDITVWVEQNAWNYIPVLTYQAYMHAPLRIDWKKDFGKWYDGYVDGYRVDITPSFTLSDFRGYLVSQQPDNPTAPEQKSKTYSLWKYYEISDLKVDANNITYAFKWNGHDLYVDNNMTGPGMTAQQIRDYTNGAFNFSWSWAGNYLTFYTHQGQPLKEPVKVFIPVSVSYGFGTLSAMLEGMVYPRE